MSFSAIKYLSWQAVYEQYKSQMGVSASDQGIKVTVDNLAVDDNYINVFYTVEDEEPIQPLSDEETLEPMVPISSRRSPTTLSLSEAERI